MSFYDEENGTNDLFDTGELRYLAKKSIYVEEEYSLDDILNEFKKGDLHKAISKEEGEAFSEEELPIEKASITEETKIKEEISLKQEISPVEEQKADLEPDVPKEGGNSPIGQSMGDTLPDIFKDSRSKKLPTKQENSELQKNEEASEEKRTEEVKNIEQQEKVSDFFEDLEDEETKINRKAFFEELAKEKKEEIVQENYENVPNDDYKGILWTLKRARRINLFKIIFGAVLTAVLYLFAFTGEGYGGLFQIKFSYLFSVRVQSAVFFLIFLLLAKDMVKSVINLFKAKADGYTLLFFSSLAVLIQAATLLLHNGEAPEKLIFYGSVTATAIVIALIGNQMYLRALSKNALSLDKAKEIYALKSIYREGSLDQTAKFDVEERKIFALKARTEKTNGFMRLAFGENETSMFYSYAVPVLVSCILVTALLLILFTKNSSLPVLVIAALGAIITPLSFGLVYALPFAIAVKRVSKYSASITSGPALQDAAELNGVILSDSDLFSRNSVVLKSIKVYGETSLDKTIIRTANVLANHQNPLSELFLKIVADPEKIKKTKILEFINGEGITATAENVKMTIGSGEYLSRSAVSVDEKIIKLSYSAKQKGLIPMFVAENSELKCIFFLKYKPDTDTTKQIKRLCDQNITVFINTFDPNLTTSFLQSICETKSNIKIIKKELADEILKSMAEEEISHSGIYMTDNRAESYCETVLESKRFKKIVRRNLIIQSACMITAPIAVLILTLFGGVSQASPLYILMFLLVWTVPILINSLFDLL